ncbi:MAG: iron uptake porin [Cyanobacteriota bacterium]|nr:iron uptake porin [Cyanobacteriota bacterium]
MVVSCSTLAARLTGLVVVAATATGMAAGAQSSAPVARAGGGESSAGVHQESSITPFSDLRPTDWAVQALTNLIQRYDCVAGDRDGAYRGPRAMTRFEAAALLQSCLDRITDVTDELKALLKDFAPELAVVRGRVNGLEARVAELEASAFSTTTKLWGRATVVVGANTFSGSAINTGANTVNQAANPLAGQPSSVVALPNATSVVYDLQLTVDTSFTGKDLLRANLRGGNFGDSVFGGEPAALSLATMEIAFEEDCGEETDCGDVFAVDKLFYQFPIGDRFVATIGPKVGQEDMLAVWPSVYPADTILNVFTVNGAPAAYSKNFGPGAGLWWQSQGLSLSANVIATNGASGNPSVPGEEGGGGLGTAFSGATGSVQLAYEQDQWGVAAIWTLLQPQSQSIPGVTPFTNSAISESNSARTNAYGLSGYWQPLNAGWLPSISLGWGLNRTTSTRRQPAGSLRTSQSWMVGLQWSDVFMAGHAFGFAVGQPVFATALTGNATPRDGNDAWECWYKFQVSDNLSITPALIYLSRPLGQQTPPGERFRQFGALIKTSLTF